MIKEYSLIIQAIALLPRSKVFLRKDHKYCEINLSEDEETGNK